MTSPDHDSRRRFRRREALTLLAASGGATVAGSLIVSQTAFADSGTIPCRYNFTGSPNAAIQIVNLGGGNDTWAVTISGVGGTCPCGGTSTIEYAYYLELANGASGGLGWIAGNAVSAGPGSFWPATGNTVLTRVGVRATCNSPSGTTIRCRFASTTTTVGAGTTNVNLPLATNNGTSPAPTGLPACNAGPIAPDQGLARDALLVVPGRPPTVNQVDTVDSAVDPGIDLGAPAPVDPAVAPADSSPASSVPSMPSSSDPP